MVQQYLREESTHQLCSPCQNNSNENEIIKKKIIHTMNQCEELLGNQKFTSKDKFNELHTVIKQRTTDLIEKIDKYQQDMDDLLTLQEKTNEINS